MTLQLPERYRLVEKRYATAPPLPTGRPATKAEVWAHYSHIYGDVKGERELRAEARDAWAFKYASWWLRGWRKQPDWVEGDSVIEDAVPHLINVDNWRTAVQQAWQRAKETS